MLKPSLLGNKTWKLLYCVDFDWSQLRHIGWKHMVPARLSISKFYYILIEIHCLNIFSPSKFNLTSPQSYINAGSTSLFFKAPNILWSSRKGSFLSSAISKCASWKKINWIINNNLGWLGYISNFSFSFFALRIIFLWTKTSYSSLMVEHLLCVWDVQSLIPGRVKPKISNW